MLLLTLLFVVWLLGFALLWAVVYVGARGERGEEPTLGPQPDLTEPRRFERRSHA